MSTKVLSVTLKSIELADINTIGLIKTTVWSEAISPVQSSEVDVLVTYSQKKEDGSIFSTEKAKVNLLKVDYDQLKEFIDKKILAKLNEQLGFHE